MGTIIDKLNRCKSIIETLCTQLNNNASNGETEKVYNLKDIETHMSKIHLLKGGANATQNDVRLGKKFYRDNGGIYSGIWNPYANATISEHDVVNGKKAYTSSGILINGTHVCSGEGQYTLTVNNNSSGTKIIKGFSGVNSKLNCDFCEYGESYEIKVNLGSIVTFIFVDKIPSNANVSSPLYRIAPSGNEHYKVNDINAQSITNYNVYSVFPDLKDKYVYVAAYCFYYAANNTSITFT